MKRPLLPVALALVGGVVWGNLSPQWLGESRLPVVWLFALCCALALGAHFGARAGPFALWPLLFVTGWTNVAWRLAVLSPHDVRLLARREASLGDGPGVGVATSAPREAAFLVNVRGVLRETPTYRLYENFTGEPQLRAQAFVDLQALWFDRTKVWEPAHGQVAVSTAGVLGNDFFAGRIVEIKGVLRRPKTAAAENLFDYRAYLEGRGIYYQLEAANTNDWRLVERGGTPQRRPLADRFAIWAQATLARGLPVEDEALRLSWAMALGWKTALTDEVSEPFMRSGTMHIFAISGLHIALIAGILVSLLRVVQVPRVVSGLIVIPLIWFYTAATGWQASAIRSTIMMSVIIGGWALKRPNDLLNSLAAAAVIILLWDPQQLLQAGFQLSFFVVLSIALLLPPFERLRQHVLKTDPFLPPELRPPWQRRLDTPLRYLTTSLATSLAAWLGSLPLVAYYFHLVTPVSLLANLVIVPLSGFALMSNLGSLLCGDWLPWLTEIFNHGGWFWMALMVWLSEWFTRWPGAYFYVPPPSLWLFAFYYLLVGAVLSGWLALPKRRVWCAVVLASLAGGLVWRAGGERGSVRLHILPLDGGEAFFLDAPGRRGDWLIDCGNTNSTKLVVTPFLRGQGVNRLTHLLLTHGDLRNVGGAARVIDDFRVEEIVTSGVRFRSRAYRQLLEDLPGSPQRWRQVSRGDALAPWTVLHPDAGDRFAQADDNAVVLRGELPGLRVLLLSDLGPEGQARLLLRGYDLRADIVVAGLPRGREPLSEDLLVAIEPRLIIVTDAQVPVREEASPALRQRLGGHTATVIYTSDHGALTLTVRRGGTELRTHRGQSLWRAGNW